MTKSKLARRRYTRRSKFERLRKSRSNLRSWMAAQNVRLAATGDLSPFLASPAVAGTENLALTANAANDETVIIGGQTYTFKTALTGGSGNANEILIGGTAGDSRDNLIAAINNDAG